MQLEDQGRKVAVLENAGKVDANLVANGSAGSGSCQSALNSMGIWHEGISGNGGRHGALIPLEQRNADLRFELPDCLAQRRLRGRQPFRRLSEVKPLLRPAESAVVTVGSCPEFEHNALIAGEAWSLCV
jgi:hypothetical protein